jgi:hypothetical protein
VSELKKTIKKDAMKTHMINSEGNFQKTLREHLVLLLHSVLSIVAIDLMFPPVPL